ncbi:hypothetical protein GGX14DRAFT_626615 [Mycena pura]|uniref:Uncharacterized protein n=1 Tax=Mycena pura TaxID=153505 RepID=A0AAD6VED0_9AGAR|nr:hypothetical protein GGX14DRAFT_626615 [Mycena pura]
MATTGSIRDADIQELKWQHDQFEATHVLYKRSDPLFRRQAPSPYAPTAPISISIPEDYKTRPLGLRRPYDPTLNLPRPKPRRIMKGTKRTREEVDDKGEMDRGAKRQAKDVRGDVDQRVQEPASQHVHGFQWGVRDRGHGMASEAGHREGGEQGGRGAVAWSCVWGWHLEYRRRRRESRGLGVSMTNKLERVRLARQGRRQEQGVCGVASGFGRGCPVLSVRVRRAAGGGRRGQSCTVGVVALTERRLPRTWAVCATNSINPAASGVNEARKDVDGQRTCICKSVDEPEASDAVQIRRGQRAFTSQITDHKPSTRKPCQFQTPLGAQVNLPISVAMLNRTDTNPSHASCSGSAPKAGPPFLPAPPRPQCQCATLHPVQLEAAALCATRSLQSACAPINSAPVGSTESNKNFSHNPALIHKPKLVLKCLCLTVVRNVAKRQGVPAGECRDTG